MSYVNAAECLPPELIGELQKYVQGALVYIPRSDPDPLPWGCRSGARSRLQARNLEIVRKKQAGRTIDQLAEEYHLSSDAIRKVLYAKPAATAPAVPAARTGS
jgi:Mor family transcriptional regulator